MTFGFKQAVGKQIQQRTMVQRAYHFPVLVFLDETFRTNKTTGASFSALAGVAIPEDTFTGFQRDWYDLVRPYFGVVLKDERHDVHGSRLLTGSTLRHVHAGEYSPHWSMAEDVINYAVRRKIRVFGVVCFQSAYQSLVCADERRCDMTFRCLFERIDVYMRDKFPQRNAKLVFDDRGHATNAKNGRAATNFLSRHTVGAGYDRIIKTPFFGVSKANNRGLQLADLVTTIIGLNFQQAQGIEPLWQRIHRHMIYRTTIGEQRISSLRVLKEKKTDSAAIKPMAGKKAQHRVPTDGMIGLGGSEIK